MTNKQQGLWNILGNSWLHKINNYHDVVGIDVFFPNFLYVKSSGQVNETQFSRMGFYDKMADVIHNGRPVWRHVNKVNFLFYNGKKTS